MAKIECDDDYPLDCEVKKPKQPGTAFVSCHDDDAEKIESALKAIGVDFRRDIPSEVTLVACDLLLDTQDVKDLQRGEILLVNRHPFSMYVMIEKTNIDYLEETRSTTSL